MINNESELFRGIHLNHASILNDFLSAVSAGELDYEAGDDYQMYVYKSKSRNDGDYGKNLADLFNAIRVNSEYERYALIPEERISTAQKYAFWDWLEHLFKTSKEPFQICDNDGKSIMVSSERNTADQVMDAVMRYYSSGNLELKENMKSKKRMGKLHSLD